MDETDVRLTETDGPHDPELERLVREHQAYEGRIRELMERRWLMPAEQLERRELKKKKLSGRDRMERIRIGYRKTGVRKPAVGA